MAEAIRIDPFEDPHWFQYASCTDKPESWFFSLENELKKIKQAKAVCANCAVRLECLEEALSFPEQPGIFGGTTMRERSNITLLLVSTQASLRDFWNSQHQ